MPFPPWSERDRHIILQHGWGFHKNCFEVLEQHLHAIGHVTCLDRGYFGVPSLFPENQGIGVFTIAVCHSLGLHFFTPSQLSRIDLLVVVSGFASFHGTNPADGIFSRKHIRRMRGRLLDDPVQLLREFYRDCSWCGVEPDFGTLDEVLLADDLELLDCSDFSHAQLLRDKAILLVHGAEDRIVPLLRARELGSRLADSQLEVIAGAGHGLPFTHAKGCADCIETFAARLCAAPEKSHP